MRDIDDRHLLALLPLVLLAIPLVLRFPVILPILLLALLLWFLWKAMRDETSWLRRLPNRLILRLLRPRLLGIVPGVQRIVKRVEERESLLWRRVEEARARRIEEERRHRAEQERKAEEERQRRAEEEARRRAERERMRQERETILARPIPPDIRRDMRAFLSGEFHGEDHSPLAYVGYRVGKTRGLGAFQRQRRLEACFRIEIPPELGEKYDSWGKPATHRRFKAICGHLKMLADMRSGRRNMRHAVADWEGDRKWFITKFGATADRLRSA